MLAIASQIILCLVLAALIGLIIGYLLGKANCPKDAYKAVTPADGHTDDDGDCGDKTDDGADGAASEEDQDTSTAAAQDSTEEEAQAEPQGLVSNDQASAGDDTDTVADFEDTSDAKTDDTVSEEAQDASAAGSNEAGETAQAEPQGLMDNGQASAEGDAAASSDEPENENGGETAAASADESEEEAAPSDDDKPAGLLDAPRDGKKDNLTRIKGIGLKIDATLNSIGVYHFDQIAAWTEKEAIWIDHYLSFPGRSLRDDWVGQAKLLAEGKDTEFSKRVDAGEVATSKKA